MIEKRNGESRRVSTRRRTPRPLESTLGGRTMREVSNCNSGVGKTWESALRLAYDMLLDKSATQCNKIGLRPSRRSSIFLKDPSS